MSFIDAITTFKPDALIGATGTAGIFSKEIIQAMGQAQQHPVIFALSNPTANAECTAEQAYEWTQGRAIFASGSPFGVVHINGEIRVPGQGNNAYVFPGLGLGAIYSGATHISDDMLIASAKSLAQCVSQNQIDQGCLYPSLKEIREVSVQIAQAVAASAYKEGLTSKVITSAFTEEIEQTMYFPTY